MEFKNALTILKAVKDQSKILYESKSEIIIKQLEKTKDNIIYTDFGRFNLKHNAPKTTKIYTQKELAEIKILQTQIDLCKAKIDALGTVTETEGNISLVCSTNDKAKEEADKRIKDIMIALGSKSLVNAASKTAKVNK